MLQTTTRLPAFLRAPASALAALPPPPRTVTAPLPHVDVRFVMWTAGWERMNLGRGEVARGLPPRVRGIGGPTSPPAVRASPAPAADDEADQRLAGGDDDALGLPCMGASGVEGDAADAQGFDPSIGHAYEMEERYDKGPAMKMLVPDCAAAESPWEGRSADVPAAAIRRARGKDRR